MAREEQFLPHRGLMVLLQASQLFTVLANLYRRAHPYQGGLAQTQAVPVLEEPAALALE